MSDGIGKAKLSFLDRHPLDFVEADGKAPTIVELRRADRGVVRKRCFEPTFNLRVI